MRIANALRTVATIGLVASVVPACVCPERARARAAATPGAPAKPAASAAAPASAAPVVPAAPSAVAVPAAPAADPAPVASAAPVPPAAEPIVAPPVTGSVRLPSSTDFVLPNGMRVFLVPDAEVPLVAFQMRLAGGAVEDPPGEEGAAALLAALLTKGAGARDAAQFQEEVEFVGGTLSAAAAPRWISLGAEFLKGDTDLALELLSDCVMRPRLDAAEFEKERGLALDALSAAREEPQELVPLYWAGWLFGKHPLGAPVPGDERSLGAMTLDRVRAAAARTLAPQRAWIVVAGDFDAAAMRKKLEDRFGGWSSSAAAPPALPRPGPADGGRVLLVDKPDALQTYFRFGNVAIDRSHPDYPARTLVNTVLGGRFTSRLNQALRIDTGLSYGAGSGFDDDAFGAFRVATYTETPRSEEAMDLALSVYRKCVEQGITAAELSSALNYVKGQFASNFLETSAQQGSMILSLAFDALPRDLVDRFYERLDAVTLEDANRVLRERFPRDLVWVVVGQGSVVRPFAGKFGTVTEVPVTAPGFGPR